MKKQRKTAIIIAFFLTFFITCLIINPQRYIASVYNGMLLFITSVAPALFPFFFFTKILTAIGTAQLLGKAFKKPIAKLYNCPQVGGYVFFMSLISGYPVGARLVGDLYNSKIITYKEAKAISSFTSTSGPLFVVGTIGTIMFKSTLFGYTLMIIHMLSAILNGLIYRLKSDSLDKPAYNAVFSPDFDNLLSKGMLDAITSVFIVGGYIAVFSMVVDVLTDLKIIEFLAKPLEFVFAKLNLPSDIAQSVIVGFVEITRGCMYLSQSGISTKTALPFVAGLLSFGGLSITLQSLTFLSACKIKPWFYLATKTTQAIISVIIALIICLFI